MLGDSVHEALSTLGITPERLKGFIGDCCCEERRRRLNELDRWARRVIKGKTANAIQFLNQILGAKNQ